MNFVSSDNFAIQGSRKYNTRRARARNDNKNDLEINSKSRHQFKWEPISKDIITRHIARSIKSTIKEKRIIDGFDTKPFGFVTKSLWP